MDWLSSVSGSLGCFCARDHCGYLHRFKYLVLQIKLVLMTLFTERFSTEWKYHLVFSLAMVIYKWFSHSLFHLILLRTLKRQVLWSLFWGYGNCSGGHYRMSPKVVANTSLEFTSSKNSPTINGGTKWGDLLKLSYWVKINSNGTNKGL